MASESELRSELADVVARLSSGVTAVTVDGVSTSFDLSALRRRRAEIEYALGIRKRRSRILNVPMGGR